MTSLELFLIVIDTAEFPRALDAVTVTCVKVMPLLEVEAARAGELVASIRAQHVPAVHSAA